MSFGVSDKNSVISARYLIYIYIYIYTEYKITQDKTRQGKVRS